MLSHNLPEPEPSPSSKRIKTEDGLAEPTPTPTTMLSDDKAALSSLTAPETLEHPVNTIPQEQGVKALKALGLLPINYCCSRINTDWLGNHTREFLAAKCEKTLAKIPKEALKLYRQKRVIKDLEQETYKLGEEALAAPSVPVDPKECRARFVQEFYEAYASNDEEAKRKQAQFWD